MTPILTCLSSNTNEYVRYALLFDNRMLWIQTQTKMSCVIKNGFYAAHVIYILGFHQWCDQNKNRNHSMKKVKSLRYDRWLIYKQPCQESGLCCFSFACYLQKCVTQIFRALYGDAMFVSFWGTQTWRPWSNRNICHWVLLLKHRIIALELRHIEINVSSSASTVQLAKTKVVLIFWPMQQPSRIAIFMSCNAKAWKFKRALLQ